ncbi:MAG: hypothetical protein DME59_15110 [Verrucomicrobia bacterium]|nr:MAG: hypothetical protein DME59_15110 [Verrucomicrobiota bacterium]
MGRLRCVCLTYAIGLIRLFSATLSQAGSGHGPEQLATRHVLRMQKRADQFRRAITYEGE